MPLTKGTTIKQVRDMVNLYMAGFSMAEIAKSYNLAPSTIQYHLNRQEDVEMRSPGGYPVERLSHDEIRQAIYLYHNCGYTSLEVGRIMGISASCVCRRLRKGGAPARPPKNRTYNRTSDHEFKLHV